MIKVSSSQFNYQYGGEIRFPYSIGCLVSYIQSKPDLTKNFKFEKSFVFRDKIDDYIKQCKDSDIFLGSCYAWNWEFTKLLVKEVKKINPRCLIILGGPQVPNHSEGFFDHHPFVDIIVHGEGEYIFEEILNAYLKDKNYSDIKGIETKDFRTPPQERINNLDDLPSAYLTNTIWQLVNQIDGVQWVAPWETNRGCPYACTFCDWGSATNTKMRKWSEQRMFKEIEWFADNKITYIDCCDANFGIYQDRDMKIAKKVKEVKLKKDYPLFFRPTWAKFSSDKIIPIAKQLQDVGLLRGVTLALQSLDDETLKIIKRENVKFEKFSELTKTFRDNKIPTYTEMIMGLPGETLESWKKGLEILLSDTKIGTIYIYHCALFPNAPMNEPTYVKFYKIKTIQSPMYLAHSSAQENEIQEFEDITITTSSYTFEELKEMYLFSWMTLTFHHLGILEQIANYYHQTKGIPYMRFYGSVLDFCRTKKSIFSEEYEKVIKYRDNGYAGKGWNHYDSKLGSINWPIEEATWLRFVSKKNELSNGIVTLLNYFEDVNDLKTDSEILKDLAKFQVFLLTTREDYEEFKSENFKFDWKSFFVNKTELIKTHKNFRYKNQILENDYLEWVVKTIWYGRISTKYKLSPERLEQGKFELSELITN